MNRIKGAVVLVLAGLLFAGTVHSLTVGGVKVVNKTVCKIRNVKIEVGPYNAWKKIIFEIYMPNVVKDEFNGVEIEIEGAELDFLAYDASDVKDTHYGCTCYWVYAGEWTKLSFGIGDDTVKFVIRAPKY